ncbi:hypothetical protein PENSPDRAFT_692938 [Peniophora sp. CONT]|nr:hypothetical protein PENSPDRAFT_692938 [Peniophora sp. CONT]
MPAERRQPSRAHGQKPYIRAYPPFTIRYERPPSRTPSPTSFRSVMRTEYEPPVTQANNSLSHPLASTPAPLTSGNPTTKPDMLVNMRTSLDIPPLPLSQQPLPSLSSSRSPAAQQLSLAPPDVFDPAKSLVIKKPKGTLGKPGAGGYGLSTILKSYGWTDDQYTAVQKDVHILAGALLDITKPFGQQDGIATVNFSRELVKRFPGLQYYEDNWPARDLATQYLKNKQKPKSAS